MTNCLENNLFRKNLHNAAIFTIYVGARFGDYRYGFKIFTHKLKESERSSRRQRGKFAFKFGKLSCSFAS